MLFSFIFLDLGDLEKRIRFLKNELAKRKAEAKKLRLETKRQKEMALKSQEARLEAEIKVRRKKVGPFINLFCFRMLIRSFEFVPKKGTT